MARRSRRQTGARLRVAHIFNQLAALRRHRLGNVKQFRSRSTKISTSLRRPFHCLAAGDPDILPSCSIPWPFLPGCHYFKNWRKKDINLAFGLRLGIRLAFLRFKLW